jgi:hypothetical protein
MRRLVVALLLLMDVSPAGAGGPQGRCATERGGGRHALALHRYRLSQGASALATSPRDVDDDHVAILEDQTDLVLHKNPFDLDAASLRLTPDTQGGYALARVAIPLPAAGTPLALGDDEARAVDLPFAFVFYGQSQTRVFVHSDGHLTFDAADAASSERNLGRFASGPPRIAPFFTDLDPQRGGAISAVLAADRAVFLWSDVPGAGQINRNTFAVSLHPDGAVEMVWGRMESREAVVGIAPGATLDVTPVDLSAPLPARGAGALAERFSERERIDLVAVARRFYRSHPDLYDGLVVYTTRPLNPASGTLAFELGVRNDVQGIGLPLIDDAAAWGSAGRLASVVFMDSIDPYLEVDGFEILGHEVGHRWLAFLRFRDPSGGDGAALLGRGESHWSFFFDSDASDMEGNDIAEIGGRFETVDFTRRYSALDQYAMGLREAEEVPPFFYVAEADDFRPDRAYKRSTAPEAGVSFTGVRRQVRVEDVVAALGPRIPSASEAPHAFHLAFLLVGDATATATEARRKAVARIRVRFEEYFSAATDGRGSVDTRLP